MTATECRQWAKDILGPQELDDRVSLGYFYELALRLPTDVGRKTALARWLTSLAIGRDADILLWVREFGVWPTSENQALYYGYRHFAGDIRDLSAAPGHLFSKDDSEFMECFLGLALYFFWDALIIVPSAGLILELSNDEVLELHSKDQLILAVLEADLRKFGLVPVGSPL